MVDIPLQFGDFGNALALGAHARYYTNKARLDQNAFEGEQAARPDIAAAVGGDRAAQGRVAQASPTTFSHIAPRIAQLDADKRAQAKATAEAVATAANTFLQAAPNERAALYPQIVESFKAQGHDVSAMPPMMTEAQARAYRGQSMDFLKADAAIKLKQTPPGKAAGGAGSAFDAPSWGGKAPAMPPVEHGPPEGDGGPPGSPAGPNGPPVAATAPPVSPVAAPLPVVATPPAAPAGAAPDGFQAMGHRTPDGKLVPAQINGQPVYRNPQTGEMRLGGLAGAGAAPAEYQGPQGDVSATSPGMPPPLAQPVGPIATPPQMAQATPSAMPPATRAPTPAAPGVVVHEIPPGYEPAKQGGVPFVTKQGFIPLISRDGPTILLKPSDAKPQRRMVDEYAADGRTLIGQRNPDTNEYRTINQPPPTDVIDPTLRGEELFSSLPPSEASQVKAVLEGRAALPSLSARMAPEAKRLRTLVFQAEPGFDSTVYAARAATQKDMADGKLAVQRTAADKLISHLGELHDVSGELNNSATPLFNKVGNLIASNRGDPRIAKFEATKHLVAEEAVKFFGGTGGVTVSGMEDMGKLINSAQSPQQLQGVMTQLTKLMHGQIEAMGEQYNRGMRYTGDKKITADSLLSESARASLQRITGNPLGGKPAGTGAPDLKKLYGLD